MALLFVEGFDWTNNTSFLASLLKWTERFSNNNSAISANGTILRFGASSGQYYTSTSKADGLRKQFPNAMTLAAGVLGVAFRHDVSSNYAMNIFTLYDTTSNVQMGLTVNSNGTLSVFRGTLSNILGTSTFAVVGGTWYYIEFKWAISDSISSGDVVVYVDEAVVLTVVAASDTKNTSNAYATHFSIAGNFPTLGANSADSFYMDDLYLLDLTGSVNNAPKGNSRVQTLNPNANGNSSQFVGSDGNSTNNYQLVDDPLWDASDYVVGANLNDTDTYGFADLVATTSVVHAVMSNIVGLRTDTDPRSVAPIVRQSGTNYAGSNAALGATSANFQTVMETNPATSSAWSPSEVNGDEFGFKVTV